MFPCRPIFSTAGSTIVSMHYTMTISMSIEMLVGMVCLNWCWNRSLYYC